jgi:hypothetical protein
VTKRWRLHAVPLQGENWEFNQRLADTFNEDPQRFYLRRSAKGAVRFYESRIYLPLRFIIIDEKEHHLVA